MSGLILPEDRKPVVPGQEQGSIQIAWNSTNKTVSIIEHLGIETNTKMVKRRACPSPQTSRSEVRNAVLCWVGAAVACPNRKVIAMIGDGSAMYTFQALWTAARHRLPVNVVVINNRTFGHPTNQG